MEEKSNTTKYFILSELSKKELHGYDLMNNLGKITGKKPSPSQVYPVLKQMKSIGYVTIKEKSDGKRKMKYYKLTSSGKRVFGVMNKKFETLIRSALGEKIKSCSHCDCEMISGGVKKAGMHFCCNSCAGSYKKA